MKTFAPLLFILTAVTLADAPNSPRSDWNVRDHVPLEKFVIQSHRGAGALVPENTLDAFEKGWSLGTAPEADLRTTKDGVIVCLHDETLSRTARNLAEDLKDRKVPDLTWDQLAAVDVGAFKDDSFAGRRIPKVTDVFAAMKGHPDRHVYLDIKNVDLKELAKHVRDHGVEKQVTLASTKNPIIQEWHALVPESDTLCWMRGTEEQLEKRFAEWRKTDYKGVTQIQIHIHLKTPDADLAKDPFKLSDAFLIKAGQEFRSHNIVFQTLPYDTTDKRIYWKLMDLGVASFATDFPDLTTAAVREYYAQKK